MMLRMHQFRCYRDSVDEYIELGAESHEQAEKIAGAEMGWNPQDVITRYVKTICDGAMPERAEVAKRSSIDMWKKRKAVKC